MHGLIDDHRFHGKGRESRRFSQKSHEFEKNPSHLFSFARYAITIPSGSKRQNRKRQYTIEAFSDSSLEHLS